MTLHYQVPLAAVKGLFTLNLQCLRLHFLTIVSITVENSNVDIEGLRLRFSKKKLEATRMHSSGMRTICSSGGGGCLPQCMLGYQPPPTRCPPGADPSQTRHPLQDLTCNACWDSTPPWRPAARHAGITPERHAGLPPPCGQTHTCKNITFATSLRTAISELLMVRKRKRMEWVLNLQYYRRRNVKVRRKLVTWSLVLMAGLWSIHIARKQNLSLMFVIFLSYILRFRWIRTPPPGLDVNVRQLPLSMWNRNEYK